MRTDNTELKRVIEKLNKRNEQNKKPYAERLVNNLISFNQQEKENLNKRAEVLQFTFTNSQKPK